MKKVQKYFKRAIDDILMSWKTDPGRKPLLLRGARQVGKSSAIKEFSKHFEFYVEINFEEQRNIHRLFAGDLSPKELCENLSVLYNTPIVAGKTLLFFDEIQSCIPAISSLRFFYEKMPDLHLISAGSLLEFALKEIPSFGVGRVRSVFVYPFSFDEFLRAIGETGLLEMKLKANAENPLPDPIHLKLISYLKKFLISGGMPEVVASYIRNDDLMAVQQILDDLIISIRSDFAKYKKTIPALRIAEVFDSVSNQTGGKFVFAKAATQTNLKQIKEALDLLIMSGLIIPVTHSSCNGIPLGAEIDDKKRKMILLDTGIFQRILGLNLSGILLENDYDGINKGAIAEMFVGLELLKSSSAYTQEKLYYWHRETASSNAEVDYVIQNEENIIPIEVKSSQKGSMQSMYRFMEEKKRKKGIRISLENFSQIGNILIIPLYAISNIKSEN